MTYQPIGNKLNKIQQSGGYQPLNIRYETIPTKEQIGKGEAFTRAAAFQAVPTTGAIASGVAGAKGGALLGSFAGPIGASVGAVVGGVGGGILGAVLTSKAQEKALEIVKGNEWMTKKQEQLSQARKDQPLASFAGEVAPQLLTLKPSPKTVGSALKFAQNILTNPKSVTAILKTPAGRAQLDDLVNVSIGGSAELGTEVYTQAKEGDFNALRLIAAGTVGSLINQPNRFGMRLGMKPSGEIEFTPDNVAPDVTPRLDVSAEAPVRPQEAPQQALKAVDDTLIQEARKYKSAEEFVKAQGTPVYHGSTVENLTELKISGKIGRAGENQIPGIYLTPDYQTASYYGRKNGVQVFSPQEVYTNGKILKVDGFAELKTKLGLKDLSAESKAKIPNLLKEKGYDGIFLKQGGEANEMIITNPTAIKTKSQLTDIWEQANEITPETRTTSVPRGQLPVSEEGETRVSRLEARMKSVLNNISPEKADEMGLTTYQRMNEDKQIKLASDYVSKNPEDAMAVLRGEKEAPVGLLYNSIALALEETSTVTADANLAIKLASLRSTRAGQEISILAKADPNNPVSAINKLIEARKARVERKTKTTASKAISKEVSELSAEVAKKQLTLTEAEALLAKILC